MGGHDGHGHHVEAPYVAGPAAVPRTIIPQIGTPAYDNATPTAFEPNEPMPKPRSIWRRFRLALFHWGNDEDMPTVAIKPRKMHKHFYEQITQPIFPLKPETYADNYERPNRCPEEFWYNPWRWPQTKIINPKIPPPIDGKYNDFYHFLAFKYWLRRERDVYVAHCALIQEMLNRCIVKEGAHNAPKNCRHIWNKHFAMTRSEEWNQTLLYMSITGNNAIRETPYPEDFVEQKRKIYDDWLFRTRMRRPNDPC